MITGDVKAPPPLIDPVYAPGLIYRRAGVSNINLAFLDKLGAGKINTGRRWRLYLPTYLFFRINMGWGLLLVVGNTVHMYIFPLCL